ncbi:MAG: dihydrofolate reductase [Bacillota bacterium]|nr:dihydrofolate reductase [Bacillota bacterium]
MNAIAVVDENWAIGRNGGLLVHLPGDLKYYKEKTWGKVIVVGRKTLESFPGGKPLPGRTNIVLTANKAYEAEGAVVCHSKEEVLEKVKTFDEEDVFIAGGAGIYREFFDCCRAFYITRIYDSFEADTYFPRLEESEFEIAWRSEMQEEKGISYQFLKYVRK